MGCKEVNTLYACATLTAEQLRRNVSIDSTVLAISIKIPVNVTGLRIRVAKYTIGICEFGNVELTLRLNSFRGSFTKMLFGQVDGNAILVGADKLIAHDPGVRVGQS